MPKPRDAAILAALLLAPATSVCAQSLSEAYAGALRHDPDFQAATADRDAAAENESLAKALFRPKAKLQANGGYSRIDTDADTVPGSGVTLPSDIKGSSGALVLGLEQPLIDGESRAQARQLRAGARAGAAVYEAQRQQLGLKVAQAYFDVLKADDTIVSLKAQEAAAGRERQAAQARFDAGRAKITDVREAQARADGLAAQIVGAQAQRDQAASSFRELTGLEPQALVAVRSDLAAGPPAERLADWQQRAETNAPAIAARREQALASQAKAEQYGWSQQIKVSARVQAGELWRGGSDTVIAGSLIPPDHASGVVASVQLEMPLYTGGGRSAQQRQAQAQARNSFSQLDGARRDLRLQVERAYRGQTSGADQIGALRTALASAELQEKAAITGRDVGVRTQSDVLAAQAQSFEARRRLDEAVYDYGVARFALPAAAGELTVDRFAAIERELLAADPRTGAK